MRNTITTIPIGGYLLLALTWVQCLPNQIKIGIILHQDQHEQEIVFRWSIDQVNRKGILNETRLVGLTRKTAVADCWSAEQMACELLEQGATAIVGPPDTLTHQHVASICDFLDVPHFNVIAKGVEYDAFETIYTGLAENNPKRKTKPPLSVVSIDLSVSRPSLIRAFLDLLNALDWRELVYVYEQDDSLYHLQEYFNGKRLETQQMNLKVIRFEPDKPYRSLFWQLKNNKVKRMVLDVDCSNVQIVLKHAQQVSMMTEAHSFLIVCLDTQRLDLEDFKFSKSQLVWFSLIDSTNEDIIELQTMNPISLASKYLPGIREFRLDTNSLSVESAQIHDAIETIAYTAYKADSGEKIESEPPISCRDQRSWEHGSTFVNYIRTSIDFNAITGQVRFDQMGHRSHYLLHLLRLDESGPKRIGNWSHANSSLLIEPHELRFLQQSDKAYSDSEQRDILIVVSKRSEPYFMNKQTTKVETGNARYEGYAIDLVDELSRLVNFDYIFKEVDDGKYGKYDEEKKEWNGMIGEVMYGKADLAIADLSITSSREDAVDFTLPFMSTGISILFKKPTTKELEFFSFLSPFEGSVWVYVCGAYIGVSVMMFLIGRISPYEWADPHPCRNEGRILRNQFSIANAFWFTMAALMQQGSDLAPRSLSTRLVSAIWYFFTLIMISSYTANLAAFLTVEKILYPIEKAEDLYRHPQKIRYGCVESGSTATFFQNSKPSSTFRKMYDEMKFTGNNEDGKALVERGNYAFFMESASIEYTVERFCNLTQIGGLLDSKGYGIALAKNSTRKRDYRTKLSEAILSLQESGILDVLKSRWWKEKRGGGACDVDDDHSSSEVKELTLKNVGGVFFVLLLGILAGFIFCACEIYWRAARLASVTGTGTWQQVWRRIKFAFDLKENY